MNSELDKDKKGFNDTLGDYYEYYCIPSWEAS